METLGDREDFVIVSNPSRELQALASEDMVRFRGSNGGLQIVVSRQVAEKALKGDDHPVS